MGDGIRVLILGTGQMGSGIARLVLEKQGLQLVGAYGRRKERAGIDLGPAIGLERDLGIAVAGDFSAAAQQRGKVHDVILSVDLGDLREGIWPDDLMPFAWEVTKMPGIRIKGLGTNLACFAGVVPNEDNMNRLVERATELERRFGIRLDCISGANSSGLELIAAGVMPSRVSHARIGEAILLGRETTHRKPWPDTCQHAFVLHAEVLQLKKKPSVPFGPRGEDAFGKRPEFEQRGEVLRALLNVGREDIDAEGLTPRDTGAVILGASSGYLNVQSACRDGHTLPHRTVPHGQPCGDFRPARCALPCRKAWDRSLWPASFRDHSEP